MTKAIALALLLVAARAHALDVDNCTLVSDGVGHVVIVRTGERLTWRDAAAEVHGFRIAKTARIAGLNGLLYVDDPHCVHEHTDLSQWGVSLLCTLEDQWSKVEAQQAPQSSVTWGEGWR